MKFTQITPSATVLLIKKILKIAIIILIRYMYNHQAYDGNRNLIFSRLQNLISLINMKAKSCHEEHDT